MTSLLPIDRATFGPRNAILHGDCTIIMADLPAASIDMIVTDPPYLVNFRARDGRQVANDNNADWLQPAASGMYRMLKTGGLCVSFYGWTRADDFITAWRKAGFRIVGHLVFRKRYASSTGLLRFQHEMAYLLAKGAANRPTQPIADVIDFPYTGNRLHPTQKPVEALRPLIASFSRPGVSAYGTRR